MSWRISSRAVPGWWAVYTKHQHEKRVAEALLAKGIEVFLPLYTSIRRRQNRVFRTSLPLFPSYVFIREQPEMRLNILSTPGVHAIVTRGSEYGLIQDHELRNLRIAVASMRTLEPCSFLQVGDRVRVFRGPLAGLEGHLVRRRNLCRVVISVELLAQAAAVEVNGSEIGPIAGRAHAATFMEVAPRITGLDLNADNERC
jgi:transcription antitermination factor NusG